MNQRLFAVLLLCAAGLRAQDDAVVRAMKDEMRRSLQKLQLEQLEKPYFISYRVEEIRSKVVSASFGNLLSSSENTTRYLAAQIRVGDYSLDNSNFFSLPFGGTGVAVQMLGGNLQLPLDDNYDEIRRQIWLATDGAYKKALEDLSGKRAALQNKQRAENIPDFSKEKPVAILDLESPVEIDLHDAEKLARQLSAIFRQAPGIQTSHVEFIARNRLERFVNSEGTSFTRRSPGVVISVTASTQAANGMPLRDIVAVYGRLRKDLPPDQKLIAEVRAMADRMQSLQSAPVEERYNGPVLFEGQAAANLVARFFAHEILAQPRILSDNAQIMQAMRGEQPPQGLLNKIGSRVFPDFVTVVDNPTLTEAENQVLAGSYKVDEEGVTPRETVVVKDGILKTMLASRSPVRGVLQSSGNMREHGIAPSNLILTGSKTSTPEELKARLIELAKARGNQYGIIVRRLALRDATLAYRVYADGHEELVRNGELVGMNVSSFKDILAISNARFVFTEPFLQNNNGPPFMNFNPYAQGQTIVSYVVPSLLFEDLTIQQPEGEIQKLPAIEHPFFTRISAQP